MFGKKHLHEKIHQNNQDIDPYALVGILENAPIGIFTSTPDGRFLFANPALAKMYGYDTPEELVNSIMDFDKQLYADPADRKTFKHLLDIQGELVNFEYRLRRRDGSIYWVSTTARAVRNDSGIIIHYQGFTTDISTRKKVEKKLHGTSERLNAILDHSPLLMSEVKPDGRYVAVNTAAADVLGSSVSGVSGKTFHELLPADTATLFMDRVAQVMAACKPITVEDHVWTNEKEFYFITTLFPLFDASGRVGSIGAISQNIIEHKKMEGTLAESESTFRLFAELAPVGIIISDQQEKIIYSSQRFFDLFGYTRQEIPHAEDWWQLAYPDRQVRKRIQRKWKEAVDDAKRTHTEIKPMEHPVICKDGTVRHVEFRMATRGKLNAVVFIDITERKNAEKELEKREFLLNKIFNVLPIGLWFADKNGKLLRGNPAGIKIWGAEPTVSMENYGVFKARRLPSGQEIDAKDWALAKTLKQGATITDELLEIETFDGQKKIILNYTAPVLDNNGESLGAIVVNNDITDRIQAEEDRERLQAQLLQAQKLESVGKLAGGVAHDYNNMLSVISGYTEIALEKISPGDPLNGDLKEIQKAARRATDITRQLLAFARKQTIRPQVLDLNDTVTDMLKMLRRLIGEDIDLSWQAGKNLWAIEIDPAQIDQILANLCVNARDAITGVGKMSIETQNVSVDNTYCADNTESSPGDYVMLAISDNGHGMDPETRKNIFEPFFTTKEVGEGTGLGLATVYGIVKQNNGFINVYTEENEGSTFKIYLPRQAGITKSPDRKKTSIARGESETILIVEDESSILTLLQKMLMNLNYNVLTANSPIEALDLTSKHPGRIDLLITDVVMPEMNGRDMVDQIHTSCPAIKTLYMSGYTANVIAHRGVLDKDINFIQKPFSIKDLAAKVREVLTGNG